MTAKPPGPAQQATTARSCLELLEARGETVGTAESLTAGLVCARLADTAGASTVLQGGVAAYALDVKTDLLGVDPAVLAQHGVYSRACAEAMAVAGRTRIGCDWAIATTGVAGPDPDQGHRAGEVYVAVAGRDRVWSQLLQLTGDRAAVRAGAVDAALALLLALLSDESDPA